MGKKLTINDFINSSNTIHKNKYDYSLVVYVNNKTKVKISCPIHGVFEQRADHHKNGRGCRKCAIDNNNFYDKNREYSYKRMDTSEFIRLSKLKHKNKYDYSLVDYKNSSTKVKIICSVHGVFEQLPNNHKDKGRGCRKCADVRSSDIKKLSKSTLLSRLDTENYFFDIKEYKNTSSKINVFCKKHNVNFKQYPKHLFNGIIGCSKCNCSIGEKKIYEYLTLNNHIFETQKTFQDCKLINLLKYDFYLPKYNLCIEYDGEQHYKAVDYFGGEIVLKKIQERDFIKNEYCNNNDIDILRIKYDEDIVYKLDQYFLS